MLQELIIFVNIIVLDQCNRMRVLCGSSQSQRSATGYIMIYSARSLTWGSGCRERTPALGVTN